MDFLTKPYVQIAINEVNSVTVDFEGILDPDLYDRYATFQEARDAALSCIELTLDAGDYDDNDHRNELEAMLALLEESDSFEELAAQPAYVAFWAGRELPTRAVA